MKTKYPINKEFAPLTAFKAPTNRNMILLSQKFMKVPGFLFKDPDLDVEIKEIPTYKDGKITLYIITPKAAMSKDEAPALMPCFINYHGGGFLFEGAFSHFRLAMAYAKGALCKVIYVKYRLAPKYPFPYPQEDCYAALSWVYDNAKELGIDPSRIGVGGDSAGGTLSVTSCLLARERRPDIMPAFQLLLYPWLDGRNNSDSFKKYTDVPMWNSKNSESMGPWINPHPEKIPLMLRSPIEASSFEHLPPAYIEVAEFDSLHDDGIQYAKLLEEAGIEVQLNDTKGTIHGFDFMVNAPTTRVMLKNRIHYIKNMA